MNEKFIQNILSLGGEEGKRWLASIPQILKDTEKKWSLTVLPPYHLSYNYVAPVMCEDGSMAVLKIGIPGDREFKEGIEALKIYNGRGVVKLLKEDHKNDVFLMEKAEPGVTLLTIKSDDEATIVAANLMKQLWRPVPAKHKLRHISSLGKGFERLRNMYNRTCGPLPQDIFDEAEVLFETNLKTSKHSVLLHGDLHYENILSSTRMLWLAIDPKGMVGEPAYDTVSILLNPVQLLSQPNAKHTLQRRMTLLATVLGLKTERIRGWAFSKAVLSAIWSVEDHGYGWENAIQFAKLLRE